MRKYLIMLVTLLLLIIFLTGMATTVVYARLGGGSSSSGSSGGGSSGSTTTSHYHSYNYRSGNSRSNPIAFVVNWIVFIFISSFSVIIFKVKIIKAKIHSKQLMRILDNKDETWKYRDIQKQVEKAYFVLQNAWAEQEMSKAIDYIDKELYDNFQTKLEWMQIRRQKNVLKKIKLIDAIPISINDDIDNGKDYIWYYIRGSMIDYTIDIDTQKIIDGKNAKNRFTEYWKFIRKDNSKWVLGEILQEDERNKIIDL